MTTNSNQSSSMGSLESKENRESKSDRQGEKIAHRCNMSGLHNISIVDTGAGTFNIIANGQIEYEVIEELSKRLDINRIMANGHLLQINVRGPEL